MKKIIPLSIIAGLLISTAACDVINSNQEENLKLDTTEAFRSDLETVLNTYFNLTEALVAENEDDARTYAEQLNEAVSDMDATDLEQEAADFWNEHAAVMKNHSEAMHGHENMQNQREEFVNLSEGMIEVMRSMGPIDGELYHQSCPMFSDEDADWLSHHEEVNHNPYQGSHMGDFFDNGHHGGGHHNGGGYGDHDHNMMECVRTVEVIE